MEVVIAIILFIVGCAGLMLWDYYKPARFRTTYRNVAERRRWTGDFGYRGDGDGGGD